LEASALHAPAPPIARISISGPLLRLRSDEQLVALFRAGNEDAFRVIHDRYRQRLFAYVRQMLSGSRQDAEDALQDVFLRAYRALRASERPITLRAWLYRVAHNRCVDQLRRPVPLSTDLFDVSRTPLRDPLLETERRDDLRRLVADVRRLPEQQRSALLMRELQGLSYTELADALGTTVAAVKSLLVRARIGLVEAAESRDAPCPEIRRDLVMAFDRGVRMSGHVRRHVRDCPHCRHFRSELRGTRHSFAAFTPAGPFGVLAKLGLGGSGAAAGGGAMTSGGGAAFAGGGAVAATATKLTIVCCAALVTVGGAEQLRSTPAHHAPASPRARQHAARHANPAADPTGPAAASSTSSSAQAAPSGAPAVELRHPRAYRHHHRSRVIAPDDALFTGSSPPPPAGSVGGSAGGVPGSPDPSTTGPGAAVSGAVPNSGTLDSGAAPPVTSAQPSGDSPGMAGGGAGSGQGSASGSGSDGTSAPPSGSGGGGSGAAVSPGPGAVSGGAGG